MNDTEQPHPDARRAITVIQAAQGLVRGAFTDAEPGAASAAWELQEVQDLAVDAAREFLEKLRGISTAPAPESRLMAEAADVIEHAVVLVGTDSRDGSLLLVGLYENADAAQKAVHSGNLPSAHYSVMTPAMNTYVQRR